MNFKFLLKRMTTPENKFKVSPKSLMIKLISLMMMMKMMNELIKLSL